MSAVTQDWWDRIPPAMSVKTAGTERIVICTSALEAMPHLAQKLCLLWGQTEFEIWVNQILMDGRDGKRQGLPQPAVEEMLFLVQLNRVKRALVASETTGLPFSLTFKQVSAAAEAAAQPAATDPWDDPLVSRDTIRRDRSRSSRAAAQAMDTGKIPWWRRLFR